MQLLMTPQLALGSCALSTPSTPRTPRTRHGSSPDRRRRRQARRIDKLAAPIALTGCPDCGAYADIRHPA
jgi:ribosomal protein L32